MSKHGCGAIFCGLAPLGLVKWMTLSSLKMLTSSMPGMVFTPSRFSVFCSRLSSVDVVLCTALCFLLSGGSKGKTGQYE